MTRPGDAVHPLGFVERLHRNYDVSFYAADARLAAGNTILACTIVSTAGPDGDIRLSSDGKENAEELARVGTEPWARWREARPLNAGVSRKGFASTRQHTGSGVVE